MPHPETIARVPVGNKLFYLFMPEKVKIISGWLNKRNQSVSCWTTWFRYMIHVWSVQRYTNHPWYLPKNLPLASALASSFVRLMSQMPTWASFQLSLNLCLVTDHKMTLVNISSHHDNITISYKACHSDLSLWSICILTLTCR